MRYRLVASLALASTLVLGGTFACGGCSQSASMLDPLRDPRVDLLAAEYMLVAANRTVVNLVREDKITDVDTLLAIQDKLLRAHEALLSARQTTVSGPIDGKDTTQWIQLAVSLIHGVLSGLQNPPGVPA